MLGPARLRRPEGETSVAAVDVESLRLIDHHRHGVVKADLDVAGFEDLIAESADPLPAGTTRFDSPLGLAVRRWCAPVLGHLGAMLFRRALREVLEGWIESDHCDAANRPPDPPGDRPRPCDEDLPSPP